MTSQKCFFLEVVLFLEAETLTFDVATVANDVVARMECKSFQNEGVNFSTLQKSW